MPGKGRALGRARGLAAALTLRLLTACSAGADPTPTSGVTPAPGAGDEPTAATAPSSTASATSSPESADDGALPTLSNDTPPASICKSVGPTTIAVTSTVPWTDTGIDVTAGAKLTIEATGVVHYGVDDDSEADANGGNPDATTRFADDVYPDTMTHSLIAKIGGTTDPGTGTPVPEGTAGDGAGFVGTSYAETLTASGRLFLGYNDELPAFGDNSGAYSVTVNVECPAFSTTVDPRWERTNEYFLAPSEPTPDLEYYADNTYSLFHEDDSPGGPAFTWTTAAWNGPATTDMPVDGPGAIPGFVPGDTWFWTTDRAGCTNIGTTYWFRTRIDVGDASRLASVALTDKYHPHRLAVNDGIIVFVDGAPQPIAPNVSASPGGAYAATLLEDDTETGWSFAELPLAPSAFHDGVNEVAILFDERCGDGGLGHLAFDVVRSN